MRFDPMDLNSAFTRDEVFPVFQPIVELRTGQTAGFEVLARWMHPEFGLIAPDHFIPAMETAGLMDQLTRTLLQKTLAVEALSHSSCSLSVNISPLQLSDSSLGDSIAETAELFGFPLERLVIELTESALLEGLPRAMDAAHRLKNLGCKLALDDFGTGYSSLRHLHALPFDELKVDRGFVSSMTTNRGSRKIVYSVVGLGQSLGLTTVAEGVETREQAEMLLWMGCELGQGWLFGKPERAEFLDLSKNRSWESFPGSVAVPLNDVAVGAEGPPLHRLAQLQAIYDGAPVGLCLLDRSMRYVSINRELAHLNGASALGHLGRTPREIVPEVFPQVEHYIRKALAGEAVHGVEIHKPPAEASQHAQILLGFYHPVRDESGEVVGVSVAIMDVSERKRMENVLREIEEHYQSLLRLNPHVPWVLNARGEVIEAGPRWESITGQPIDEAMGDGWLRMLHPQDKDRAVEAVSQSVATGAAIDVRYRVRNEGGVWRWMRARGMARCSASGQVIGIYGVVEELLEHAMDSSSRNEHV